MKEVFKRGISGTIYITIMWIGISFSKFSFHLLFFILAIISLYEMWKLRKGKSKLLAFSYIILPFLLIHFFGTDNQNHNQLVVDRNIVLLILILTWSFDTFAYLIGVKFGKHKIMPSISPKKSWEGFFGGYIFTVIMAYITAKYFTTNLKLTIIISILIPLTATIGDFIESYYKREANVKDSGNLIPGHGGILDRIDALMITIPITYIIIQILQ